MMIEAETVGIKVVATQEYGNHYAVIDNEPVWNGGMNLFGIEDVWDNLIRAKDPDAA